MVFVQPMRAKPHAKRAAAKRAHNFWRERSATRAKSLSAAQAEPLVAFAHAAPHVPLAHAQPLAPLLYAESHTALKLDPQSPFCLLLPMRAPTIKSPPTQEEKRRVLAAFHNRDDCRRLINKLFTVKQVRTEPTTCDNEVNKAKRKAFADALVQHEEAGNYIVFYDETNFNLYCKRTQGRAKQGDRATLLLPPSKGPNLQIQCAVSVSDGELLHRLERGSIRMEQNADYCEAVYRAAKQSTGYNTHYQGKKIVIVLDNAPANQQTEKRIPFHEDAVILRLGPYSPMCNPIEGCFSVLKGEIKVFLRLRGDEMTSMRSEFTTMTKQRMTLLERAAQHSIACITPHLVMREFVYALRFIEAARLLESMQYGS